MTEKRQNEVCCEVLGFTDAQVNAYFIARFPNTPKYYTTPLFTCNETGHANAHSLRAAVIEAGLVEAFMCHLDEMVTPIEGDDDASYYWFGFLMMQAAPAQQVEAALRALGRWENEQ